MHNIATWWRKNDILVPQACKCFDRSRNCNQIASKVYSHFCARVSLIYSSSKSSTSQLIHYSRERIWFVEEDTFQLRILDWYLHLIEAQNQFNWFCTKLLGLQRNCGGIGDPHSHVKRTENIDPINATSRIPAGRSTLLSSEASCHLRWYGTVQM